MGEQQRGSAGFPGGEEQPSHEPTEEMVESEPLDLGGTGDDDHVIRQQNVGLQEELGGGEFPDRDRRSTSPAPGSVDQPPVSARTPDRKD